MKKVTINLDDAVYQFYQKVGNSAQRPVEQVISDALFKLAGELSLEALHKKYKQGCVSYGAACGRNALYLCGLSRVG